MNPVNVAISLNNLTSDAPTVADPSQDLTITLKANEGYLLPKTVSVSVGNVQLSLDEYVYDSSTGKLTIPSKKIVGDIEIEASALENSSSNSDGTGSGSDFGNGSEPSNSPSNTQSDTHNLPETSDSAIPIAIVMLILGIGAIMGIAIALRKMRR